VVSVEGLLHYNATVILHSCLSLDCVVRSPTLSATIAIASRVKLLPVNYAEHSDLLIWKFSKYKHFIIHLWLFHARQYSACYFVFIHWLWGINSSFRHTVSSPTIDVSGSASM